MPNAVGKHAYGICDKTGFRYKLSDLVFEIKNGTRTGMRVGKDVVDHDHPQNFIGRVRVSDGQSLANARPNRLEPDVINLLQDNPFTTGASGGVTTTITVTEVNHGRDTGDIVRFRNVEPFDGITQAVMELSTGYSITKVSDDTYTVSVSGGATTGSVSGGGFFASAGPVTALG
jgi:hypothetical protein